MYAHPFYPLRTIVGSPIQIVPQQGTDKLFRHEGESAASRELAIDYDAKLRTSLEDSRDDADYLRYFTVFESDGGTTPPRSLEQHTAGPNEGKPTVRRERAIRLTVRLQQETSHRRCCTQALCNVSDSTCRLKSRWRYLLQWISVFAVPYQAIR